MGTSRFSDTGKEYLASKMDKWAKSIAAHLLGNMVEFTSDPSILAAAMDVFPSILCKQMERVLDDIDNNLQLNGLVEKFDRSEGSSAGSCDVRLVG